jgi:hypothetical protein
MPVQSIEMPAKRFSHVHIDLVGPFPAHSSGYSHLFTVVDRSTRWAEAIPLRGTSTRDCTEAFFSGWVSCFGVPALVTLDRGPQFTSEIWQAMCNKLGIHHKATTAYHPQANGMVERFHRQLKASLRARLEHQDWLEQLPWVLLGLQAAPKEESALSSAEMVYGTPLTLPGEFVEAVEPPPPSFLQSLRESMSVFRPPPVRGIGPPASLEVPNLLQKASLVYIRRGGVSKSLAPLYSGRNPISARNPISVQFLKATLTY